MTQGVGYSCLFFNNSSYAGSAGLAGPSESFMPAFSNSRINLLSKPSMYFANDKESFASGIVLKGGGGIVELI